MERAEDYYAFDGEPEPVMRPKGRQNGLGQEWRDPAPLPNGLPPVLPFNLVMLPDALRPWVSDVAERMQVPADYPAVAAMIALAAVVGRQVGIRPKCQDDWLVVPNLWGGIVGRPGLMKTPSLTEALRPLVALEMEAKEENAQAMKEFEARKLISAERKKLQGEMVKKGLKSNRDERGIIAELMASTADDEEPQRRRYLVNDATVEKLGAILGANPRGVLQFRDELVGFLRGLERDGREQDRAFHLEAWNGNGRFTYDRIGRGTLDVEACCTSLLGGIQPGPLMDYLQSTARGGAGDDGLLQRFQLLVWPDPPAVWRNVDRWPDRSSREAVHALFTELDRLSADQLGAATEDGDIPSLRFDEEAQSAFDQWRTALEARLRSDLHPAFEAHLAKYRSLLPSLALLCHLADGGTGSVGFVSFARAEAWTEYLESHARRIYDALLRADLAAARALGERLAKGELPAPFQARDVYRKGWAGLSDINAARAALDVLVDLDWLKAEDSTPAGGGRPTVRYHINPKLSAHPGIAR